MGIPISISEKRHGDMKGLLIASYRSGSHQHIYAERAIGSIWKAFQKPKTRISNNNCDIHPAAEYNSTDMTYLK